MNLSLLLDMAASGFGDRVVVGSRSDGLTAADLRSRALSGAGVVREAGAAVVLFLATNGPAFPVALFAAAAAGVPIVPLNYRLGANQLSTLLKENTPALLVADERAVSNLELPADVMVMSPAAWLDRTAALPRSDADGSDVDPELVALQLYTSGTTAAPKAALLRHRHLTSYVLSAVEFGAADPGEASLVSVPPYHVAGVSNTITNLYVGRRVVHLPDFDAAAWLTTVRDEGITNALVVPTMLARVVEHLGDRQADMPALRSVAYGGAAMPATVIARALRLFPDVGFVNAYGLTETSSTIALLGPEEHRAAAASCDPAVRARLGSAGRVIPGVEVQIRAGDGSVLPPRVPGELWVRGPQVSGEYRGTGSGLDAEGWFHTRDQAYLDDGGYLFVLGRADDTIIRGGENIAPAEIEEVLREHPGVADVAVVGLPDEQWGQKIAAAVVPAGGHDAVADELREHVRGRLRSSKVPDVVMFVADLPYSDLGKLSRRAVASTLSAEAEA